MWTLGNLSCCEYHTNHWQQGSCLHHAGSISFRAQLHLSCGLCPKISKPFSHISILKLTLYSISYHKFISPSKNIKTTKWVQIFYPTLTKLRSSHESTQINATKFQNRRWVFLQCRFISGTVHLEYSAPLRLSPPLQSILTSQAKLKPSKRNEMCTLKDVCLGIYNFLPESAE